MRLWTLGLVLVTGCADLCAPKESLPADAREVSITPRYAALWRQIDSCSGLPRPIDAVRFYIVPGVVFEVDGVKMLAGYQTEHRRVLLSVWADTESSGNTIRHEMLHAHLGDHTGHPPEYFGTPGIWTNGKCGRLVNYSTG